MESRHGWDKVDVNLLPRVLLVENDKPSVDITKFYLKEICSIDVAANGEEAMELVGKNNYTAVLMDINLGTGVSGIDIEVQIKELTGYKDTAIVALTAFAGPGDKEFFLSSGFTHYLAKPFDKSGIVQLMNEILSPKV